MKALFGENPAVQPLLIDDSLAAPTNSNDEDDEATGEVDVHHDERSLEMRRTIRDANGSSSMSLNSHFSFCMCDLFLGSPVSPLEIPPGPGQEEEVRNSPPRDVADDVTPLPSPLPEP
ncbi:hypothetical protein PsorP6_003952 [Peronosclerospora sorghi]|uniref:Uncharacterized protein n=1 Tax=Peronosclerospora sorghi TaxID=230839 RepID=A0ACC0VLZ0_9STRA|nr:hypothetical protein PsorP6_003952 [Peronosclerospora sorghi]